MALINEICDPLSTSFVGPSLLNVQYLIREYGYADAGVMFPSELSI
jgi:hypothetical protein